MVYENWANLPERCFAGRNACVGILDKGENGIACTNQHLDIGMFPNTRILEPFREYINDKNLIDDAVSAAQTIASQLNSKFGISLEKASDMLSVADVTIAAERDEAMEKSDDGSVRISGMWHGLFDDTGIFLNRMRCDIGEDVYECINIFANPEKNKDVLYLHRMIDITDYFPEGETPWKPDHFNFNRFPTPLLDAIMAGFGYQNFAGYLCRNDLDAKAI